VCPTASVHRSLFLRSTLGGVELHCVHCLMLGEMEMPGAGHVRQMAGDGEAGPDSRTRLGDCVVDRVVDLMTCILRPSGRSAPSSSSSLTHAPRPGTAWRHRRSMQAFWLAPGACLFIRAGTGTKTWLVLAAAGEVAGK
jgi:hypothetical protein